MDRHVLQGTPLWRSGAGPVCYFSAGGVPVLAALYESWSVPFSVIMVIPLGLLGAALAATLRGLSNDVYFRWRC